jgi:hypothetical protein
MSAAPALRGDTAAPARMSTPAWRVTGGADRKADWAMR